VKWTKIKAISAPTGAITNLRWFGEGTTWGTGVELYAGAETTYTQSTAASIGTTVATVNATSYTAAAPLTIQAGTVVDSGSAVPSAGNQDYVCQQVRVTSAASAGVTSARASKRRGSLNIALTGKPKFYVYNKIWQSRVVEGEISKATYRLIDALMFGYTKKLDNRVKSKFKSNLNAIHFL